MSHFTVMIIGDDIENKLAPYQENNMGDCPEEYLEFKDVDEEYSEKWKNGTRKEFYCESCSSWGFQVPKEFYEYLVISEIDTILTYKIKKSGTNYLKSNCKYHCYWKNNGKRMCNKDDDIWIEVIEIIDTDHPDKDVCFEGTVKVKKISPPKEIAFKEMYSDYETFIEKWAGYSIDEKTGKYGYWENPNAKWDWYQIGGRWTGLLKLKNIEDVPKEERYLFEFTSVGAPGLMTDKAEAGTADSAPVALIDWDKMKDDIKKHEDFWDNYVIVALDEKYIKLDDEEKRAYLHEIEKERDFGFVSYLPEYYIERYKDKETYARISSAFSTYAVIDEDGKWHAPGTMGWFGCSSDEGKDKIKFVDNFHSNFIEPLSPETPITIVDCHI